MARLQGLARRPTLWVEVSVAVAWTTLAAGAAAARGSGGFSGGGLPSHGTLWLCTLGAHGISSAGTDAATAGTSITASTLLAAAPMWALMSGAMMVPSAMPAVQHVASHSLYWRRRRAAGEFIVSFLGIWLAFSVLVLGALTNWEQAESRAALPAALALAALWQLTPFKLWALRGCHRSSRLPPRGWQATMGAGRFGLSNGCACLASCWALMSAVALSRSPIFPWMAVATVLVYLEKKSVRPRRAARRLAILLAAAALGVALAALLG
jgi:predicted metal-binding membrane protein